MKPEELIISLRRSAMWMKPSRRRTRSPVRSQPSTKHASVSSGWFQYPENTCGPRASSSPTSPSATSWDGSSGSTMRTSVEG